MARSRSWPPCRLTSRRISITEALSPPQPKISKSPLLRRAAAADQIAADRIKAILKGWLPLLNEDGLIEAERISLKYSRTRGAPWREYHGSCENGPSRLN
jgi:hypothetical protein